MTKRADVSFDDTAGCPRWEAFLDRIMGGNQDLINYLRRVAGLFLTGDVSVQELFIFHGGGANGKSVFLDTVLGLLGDYGATAPDSLVTARGHDQHPTEIADLCGRRLVVASETEEGAKLRVQLVKRLTGDAKLKARFMRQDFFEFARTHKLVLVTNNKPIIRETNHAVWRRIRLVPFAVTIPDGEQDPKLLDKLAEERPGILNWMVAGCLDWQRGGMRPPDDVLLATDEYRSEQDPLGEYLRDRCLTGSDRLQVSRNDLLTDYLSWSTQAGEAAPLRRNSFYDQIRRLSGVAEVQWKPAGSGVPVRGFKGIGLAYVHRGKEEGSSFETATHVRA